jgi:hypothetical protein
MRSIRPSLCCLSCLALVGVALPCRADAPADPLRLVPAEANIFLKIEQPRQLVDAFLALDATKQALKLAPVREFYDSTTSRRLFQLLAYFEKRLGASRFELLDRLAAGGVALAVKVGTDPPPALLVIQGKDEKLTGEFVRTAEEVINQELARQEKKGALKEFSHSGVKGIQIPKTFYLAAAGSTLLVSNQEEPLKRAIDLHAASGKSIADNPGVIEAGKLLPSQRLAWVWLNLEPIRNLEKVKEAIPAIELNPVTAPFVSSWLDVAKRAPFLCASLGKEGADFHATVRLPRGMEGMAPAAAVYLPQEKENTPPLLEPKNVQISTSHYLDLGRLWDQRDKVLSKEALKGLESFEKNSGRFLGGIKLGKLLKQAGAHQRFVQANQPDGSSVYKKRPKQPISSFALVQEMRDPAFAKSMNSILRTVAILGAFQFNLKLAEEKYQGCNLVTYRFPEDKELKNDPTGLRYSFTPTFTHVGNQFVVSSTVELARELVDLLHKEGKVGQKLDEVLNAIREMNTRDSASVRARLYSSGLASQLRAAEQQIITQFVLGQALSPAEAREQFQALLRIVEGLGNLDVQSVYGRSEHRLDLRFNLGR